MMRAHAGAIELVNVSEAGEVRVRFVGKCTGCELRPVTMAATIRPGLLAVDGVVSVTASGARVSEEAELRLLAGFGPERRDRRVIRVLERHRKDTIDRDIANSV